MKSFQGIISHNGGLIPIVERTHEYTWGKYGSKGMNHFYRTAERVINEDTIECDITITLDDDSMRFHKIRLRVDDNGVWSVISDKIVD